ncbi:MAG: biotin synthase BioB [Bacteroidia bacterium]
MAQIRNDWTFEEIQEIYHKPLIELVFEAAQVHREHHDPRKVQIASLLSIKTGGCPEDCAYCPQAARYNTGIDVHKLMEVEEVVSAAQNAKDAGASRFCMGAAWREVRDNRDFDKVLSMVTEVNKMGMEVCCTLGMLSESQANKLKDAGCMAYNHNVDTSEDFYTEIISTRKYNDRLKTLDNVMNAGITVCAGGIIGMGETDNDRIGLLYTLATLKKHPASVPINKLIRVEGTPLENEQEVPMEGMARMVATARIVMPESMVRLSAGRREMSKAEQFLCFLAGANSIHSGDKLLTTPTGSFSDDLEMLKAFGMMPLQPSEKLKEAEVSALAE